MQMRRLTRLTNALSKRWENLRVAYCRHFEWYNFCRIHQSLRITPAMAAGITDSCVGTRRIARCPMRTTNKSAARSKLPEA